MINDSLKDSKIAKRKNNLSEEDKDDPKGKSKISDEESNEIEDSPIVKNEKKAIAQGLQDNFFLSLTMYLDNAKLSNKELSVLLKSKIKVSLFNKTLNEIIPNFSEYDLNNEESLNVLIKIITQLTISQQHDLFLAEYFDNIFKTQINDLPLDQKSNELLTILTLVKEHINSRNNIFNKQLFENLLSMVKERLTHKLIDRIYESQSLNLLNYSLVKEINEFTEVNGAFNVIYLTLLGADLNFYYYYNTQYFFEAKGNHSQSFLEVASSKGNTSLIRFLIAFGADPNHYHPHTKIPFLNRAVTNKDKIEVLKFLIKYGANINLCGLNGKTLLLCAVKAEHEDMIKYLIDKKVDINAIDNNGKNALHYSCSLNIEIIKLLLNKGINANLKDKSNKLPVSYFKYKKYLCEAMINQAYNGYDEKIKLLENSAKENESITLPSIISNNDNVSQQYINTTNGINIGQSRGI